MNIDLWMSSVVVVAPNQKRPNVFVLTILILDYFDRNFLAVPMKMLLQPCNEYYPLNGKSATEQKQIDGKSQRVDSKPQ